jgi:hypothetical protein
MRPCAAGLIDQAAFSRSARWHRARQAITGRPAPQSAIRPHGSAVGRRRDREPCLDDVDTEDVELTGQEELFGRT